MPKNLALGVVAEVFSRLGHRMFPEGTTVLTGFAQLRLGKMYKVEVIAEEDEAGVAIQLVRTERFPEQNREKINGLILQINEDRKYGTGGDRWLRIAPTTEQCGWFNVVVVAKIEADQPHTLSPEHCQSKLADVFGAVSLFEITLALQ